MTTTEYIQEKDADLNFAFVIKRENNHVVGSLGIQRYTSGGIFVGVQDNGKVNGIIVPLDNLIVALRDAGIISGTEGMTSEEEREYAAAMEPKS